MKKLNDETKNGVSIVPESLMTLKEEFDIWFSRFGGIVLGSSIYVTGTSGGGKSTLMANIMTWLKDEVSLMYSREMLAKYLKAQVSDLKFPDNAYIADVEDNPNFDSFMQDVYKLQPKIIIIDSLQVIAKEDYVMTGIMGEDAACYKIIKTLRDYVNSVNGVLFLIGHNTKDGVFAGANTNMQMIDAHIDIVYDKITNTRTMSWGQKNRKGPMGEPLPFSIDKSEIIFNSKNETLTGNEYNAFYDSFNFIQGILESETFLRKASEEQKKLFRKRLAECKKKNLKGKIGSLNLLAANIVSWLELHEKLELNTL